MFLISYYLEGKKFLYIIFEVPGKENKKLKVDYKNKRGKYIFYIEGKKINNYDEFENQKDEIFYFSFELYQKHIGFKINSKSEKEIKFEKGIYTIKYHIEEKK
jgi:HSP20 family molecular chaperone IbpA